MAWPERQLLGSWTYSVATSGNLGAGASTSFTAAAVNAPNLPQGLLNGNQVGEVESIICYSPINQSTGAADDLKYIQLVLDGQQYPFIYMSGRNDSTMAPAFSRVAYKPQFPYISLGQPTFGLNGTATPPLQATCPKFISSVVPMATAGTSAVTHDFTIELWGYVYSSVVLAQKMPAYGGGNYSINDARNNRTFVFPYPQVLANQDWRGAWTSLPGGLNQATGTTGLPVNKFIRTSLNAVASTVNQAFVPSWTSSNVANPWDNLFFQLNLQQAILVERYGVRGPAAPNSAGNDLLTGYLAVPNQAPQQAPAGGIPAAWLRSDMRYGLRLGLNLNDYDGVPFLPEGPQLVWNEQAYLTWVDNGVSIGSGNVRQAFVGTLIGSNAQGV